MLGSGFRKKLWVILSFFLVLNLLAVPVIGEENEQTYPNNSTMDINNQGNLPPTVAEHIYNGAVEILPEDAPLKYKEDGKNFSPPRIDDVSLQLQEYESFDIQIQQVKARINPQDQRYIYVSGTVLGNFDQVLIWFYHVEEGLWYYNDSTNFLYNGNFNRNIGLFDKGTYYVTVEVIKGETSCEAWADRTVVIEHYNQVTFFINSSDYVCNGEVFSTDAAPILDDGRVFVSVSFVADTFRAEAEWNSVAQKVTLTRRNKIITIRIGEYTLELVEGNRVFVMAMDVAALIRNGKTYLPFRFIAEAFGAEVEWGPLNAPIEWVAFVDQFYSPFELLEVTNSNVRFFEGDDYNVPFEERIYKNVFPSTSRYIYFELALDYPETFVDMDYPFTAVYYTPNGEEQIFSYFFIDWGWTSSYHSAGYGYVNIGYWHPGTYTVKIFDGGHELASGNFTISSDLIIGAHSLTFFPNYLSYIQDGEIKTAAAEPTIISNPVSEQFFVPAKTVAEAYAAELDRSPEHGPAEIVTLKRNNLQATMESGSSVVTILEDGITRSINMEQPLFLNNDEIFLSARAVSGIFRVCVNFDINSFEWITFGKVVTVYKPVTSALSVAIDNHINAKPQSGLNEATVVYETSIAPGITRFLALYDLLEQDVTAIGPVRSAREHLVSLATGHGGSFAHAGGSGEALSILSGVPLLNFDEIYGAANYFYRDPSGAAPHNLYTNTESIKEGINDSPRTLLPLSHPWPTGNMTGGIEANAAEVRFIDHNNDVEFRWEGERYIRYEKGQQVLLADSNPVEAGNIVVLKAPHEKIYKENLQEWVIQANVIGSGPASFYRDGMVWEGKWEKTNHSEPFSFTVGNDPMVFATGNIWILIASSNTYSLIMQTYGQGSTQPDAGTHCILENEIVKLTAVPDEGWQFQKWVINDSEYSTDSVEINMDSNKTVNAYFIQNNSQDECFIATAAYGSKLNPAVALLRQFRDAKLMTNIPGRKFVSFYYNISPPIAKYLAKNTILKWLFRIVLLPVIAAAYLLMNPRLLFFIMMGCVALFWWMRYRRAVYK